MEPKQAAALRTVSLVKSNMVVGLGTGSTARFAIEALGARVRNGLHIRAVASSVATETLARAQGIPVVPFSEINGIDLAIDGADEVDPQHNLIKGGGGALLREKILAYNSQEFIVIVAEKKLVRLLGAFPLPVEIVPFGAPFTLKQLERLGCTANIRMQAHQTFITDNGHLIADCHFGNIDAPEKLSAAINAIPGVVENGLFSGKKVSRVIVGYASGAVAEHRK